MTLANPPHGCERDVVLRMRAQDVQILVEALDLYSRLGMGQWSEVATLARDGLLQDSQGERPPWEAVEQAEAHLARASQAVFGFPRNASHGIFSPRVHASFLRAWGICKAAGCRGPIEKRLPRSRCGFW